MKISEEIAETLRDEIVAGIYKPRERLIEEELSEKFFVSRTPIREALKQLESAGLVKIEPYRGAFVAEVDLEEIRNIYELRCILESFVAGLAVECITSEIISSLRESLRRMELCIDAGDMMGFALEDERFHSLIYGQCPNKVAVRFVQQLLDLTSSFRRLSWRTTNGMRNSMKGHQKIFDAIMAGDAEAVSMYASRHIRLYLKESLTDSQQML